MSTYKLFQKFTVAEVATRLDVLPGELARHLGQGSGLPSRLWFDEKDIEKLYIEMELRTWWPSDTRFFIQDEEPKRRLVRELSHRILKHGLVQPQRYDNLLRGVGGEEKIVLRSYLNFLLKSGILTSQSNISSLELRLEPEKKSVLEDISKGTRYPAGLENIWSV